MSMTLNKQLPVILILLSILAGCQNEQVHLKASVLDTETGDLLFAIPLTPTEDGARSGRLRRPVTYDAIAGVYEGEKRIEKVYEATFPEDYWMQVTFQEGEPAQFSFDFQYVDQLVLVHRLESGRELMRPVAKQFKGAVPVNFKGGSEVQIDATPAHTIVLNLER